MADLRVILSQVEERHEYVPGSVMALDQDPGQKDWGADGILRANYAAQFDLIRQTLDQYTEQLDDNRQRADMQIGDDSNERATLAKIDEVIARIAEVRRRRDGVDWLLEDASKVGKLREDVEELRALAAELPSHLHDRLHALANDVRTQYRMAIPLAWATVAIATLLLLASAQLFRKWFAQPLQTLVDGSREVAAGKFDHRIRLDSDDEMGELADAMNAMTARFQEIRDDLDRQVQRAHQAGRPQRAARQRRLPGRRRGARDQQSAGVDRAVQRVARRPPRRPARTTSTTRTRADDARSSATICEMIQKEAFRCKQITEKLLDFSRTRRPAAAPHRPARAGRRRDRHGQHLGQYQQQAARAARRRAR